ncbi:hypothetical protein BC936DRAFT_138086 [Jimgerdemannia flammicorona]|uniref:Uncharacterized protein n=1 Tax=Jimgerdemannia flammicorona TaxID=994334 RepID=A0A433CVX2_9FUNG|nr:hypothetical protein BC936DRAFT_138086 [Jimgerdemannia flammicorona]
MVSVTCLPTAVMADVADMLVRVANVLGEYQTRFRLISIVNLLSHPNRPGRHEFSAPSLHSSPDPLDLPENLPICLHAGYHPGHQALGGNLLSSLWRVAILPTQAFKSQSRFSISLVCLEVFWSRRAVWARTDRMRGTQPTFSSAAMGLENFEHRFWMHMVCGDMANK